MTLIEVLRAKMYPYELPDDTLNILLLEQGVEDVEDSYEVSEHKEILRKATLDGLYQVLTLKEESDNGSTLKYDVDAIKDRISHYTKPEEADEETKPLQIDKTPIW